MALTSGQSGVGGSEGLGLFSLVNGDSNDMFEVVSVSGNFLSVSRWTCNYAVERYASTCGKPP